MEKIGVIHDIDGTKIEYYQDGNEFINSEPEMKDLALCINSPWSQLDEIYEIKYNYDCAFTAKPIEDANFICKYKVTGYEMIESEIYGYGDTPCEAMNNCISLFNTLQERYNQDDESF